MHRIIEWVVLSAITLGGVFIAIRLQFQPLKRSGDIVTWESCESNFKEIGAALAHYASVNHGQYPSTLGALLLTEEVAPRDFICIKDGKMQSVAPTTRAQAQEIDSGSHVSYIYLGKGLNTDPINDHAVLLYEPLSNHKNGTTVLFGDGHVEFFDARGAQMILDQVVAGKWPVTIPSTRPAP